MSVYPPPNYTEPIPIFNTVNWETSADGLTRAEADLRYLRYPVAQGLETLQEINVNGVATFNNTILANQPLNIVENTNPLQKSVITQNGTTFDLLNDNNSGTINLSTKTGVGVQTTPLSVTSADLTITTTNPPTCSAVQPLASDSSTKMPTTAWVQSAIASVVTPPKTYTIEYTTTTSIVLPTNCVGLSVTAVGKGGLSGNASNSSIVGLWNAGGSGSAGTTITSNGILPFRGLLYLDVIINNFYSELYATSIGVTVCRANAGVNGANATFGGGGAAGVSNNTWITNTGMCSWNVQIGASGPAGGTNLAFQSATYPATGGIPICNNWLPATIHGCGQNWNGVLTTNSYQGPAQAILGGAVWITYYLS